MMQTAAKFGRIKDWIDYMTPLTFVRRAKLMLLTAPAKQWAETFVYLRMRFCREHSNGYIFSTRFGAAFFDEVEEFLSNNKSLQSENGQKLGEYDENFNRWLKVARMIK
jgi:hypothetical protein